MRERERQVTDGKEVVMVGDIRLRKMSSTDLINDNNVNAFCRSGERSFPFFHVIGVLSYLPTQPAKKDIQLASCCCTVTL